MVRPFAAAMVLALAACAARTPAPDPTAGQRAIPDAMPEALAWPAAHTPAPRATGTVESFQPMPSRHVAARRIDVWLPPSYAAHPGRRYPVLYLHDGQNLFDPALSYGGVDWDIDGVMTREIAAGRVREAIVVGIWNSPARFAEYMPAKAVPPGPIATGVPASTPASPKTCSRTPTCASWSRSSSRAWTHATARSPGRRTPR